MFAGVSEGLAASNIRAMSRLEDSGSKHLWNVYKLLPHYTAQQPRRSRLQFCLRWYKKSLVRVKCHVGEDLAWRDPVSCLSLCLVPAARPCSIPLVWHKNRGTWRAFGRHSCKTSGVWVAYTSSIKNVSDSLQEMTRPGCSRESNKCGIFNPQPSTYGI
jgi:hypothetical protein